MRLDAEHKPARDGHWYLTYTRQTHCYECQQAKPGQTDEITFAFPANVEHATARELSAQALGDEWTYKAMTWRGKFAHADLPADGQPDYQQAA